MPDPNDHGKTLWEMLKERFSKNGSNVPFYNPLDLRIGAMVAVSKSRHEFENYDFSVKEIREYNRRIGGQDFRFTDYVLAGVNTATFSAEDALTVRLRAVPNLAGAQDVLLLELDDEFAFDAGFLDVVKDTTGIFEVTDDKTGVTETFLRINDVKESYEAAILVITGTTDDGKAPPGQVQAAKLEYWDYWRDVPLEGSQGSKKQFIFVEMNSDTGWFQIWRGGEFFL